MPRVAQFGIALGTLGAVLAVMGLFPGITGIEPTLGFGIAQIVSILGGFSLLIIGALIYVKFTFYPTTASRLAQQIAIRLALTGLVFAALSGLADILGFGSHARTPDLNIDIFLGPWQATGLLGSFLIAALGVLLYALTGDPEALDESGKNADS